jgi:hypothetical protein
MEFPTIESPVVGKWYTVPCVIVQKWGAVPVHGPWHEDEKYIGFKRHHFHVDWRFASPRYRAFVMDHMDHFAPRYAPLEQLVHNRVICEMITNPVLRQRRCQRLMPDFPNAKFVVELERAYHDHVLDPRCLICPHRGMQLAHGTIRQELPTTEPPVFQNSYRALPFDESSHQTVVCPGHGLKWNLTTGKLAPRGTSGFHLEEAAPRSAW